MIPNARERLCPRLSGRVVRLFPFILDVRGEAVSPQPSPAVRRNHETKAAEFTPERATSE